MKLDWIDIILHVISAIVIMSIGIYTGHFLIAFIINTLFWPIREAIQHKPDYLEIITHPQSLAEWLAPVLVGVVVLGCPHG